LAVSVQGPTDTRVKVLPLTVQTPVVEEVTVTASPELAVATSAGGDVPRTCEPGDVNVMVWAAGPAGATVTVCITEVAAA
jgi:hypothetical protein